MSGADLIIESAKSQLGAPYVYGAWGQLCTPALRKKYARLTPSQADKIYARCPVLSDKQKTCDGCKYDGMLAFDCRGFTHWCVLKTGIDIYGQKVSVQYDTSDNWDVRGDIAWMPELVCCIFLDGHTGMYLLDRLVIHCSGEVKAEELGTGRKWTRFAIPKGLYTMREIADALAEGAKMETLRRGSFGQNVAYLQALLNDAGYDCGLIDGKYGAKTEKAVRALQEANGVKADGICGPATWALLVQPDAPELDEDDDLIPEIPEIGTDEQPDTTGPAPDGDQDMARCRQLLEEALAILNRMAGRG